MMHTLQVELLLGVLSITSSWCVEFTDWPHIVTSQDGGSATFNWRIDESLDSNEWTTMQFDFGDTVICSLAADPPTVTCPGDYEARTRMTDSTDRHIVGFTLSDVTVADAGGPYSCLIRVRALSMENKNASLAFHGPPTTPAITPSPYTAVENDTFTLTCFADHTSVPADLVPDITYSWIRNGVIPSDRHTVTGSHGEHLIIQPVTRDDHQKTYKCEAREADRTSSSTIQMTVSYGPNAIFLDDPGPIIVTEGDPVSVTCQADCSPTCSFRWTRSNDPSWSDEDAVLNFPSIEKDFHDMFTCSARNDYGLKNVILQIIVHFPSQIIEFLPSPDDKLSHGESVSLICSVDSRPDSDIMISNTTTELSRESGHQAQYQFPAISILDSGEYRCSAQNEIPPNSSGVNILDVKGGFHNCDNQSDTVVLGVELGVVVVQTFCQFANPFTEVSRNNWVFDALNTTSTTADLPGDITISVEPTENDNMKIIHFNLPAVTQSHLGEYTMTNQNTEGDALVVNLKLTPEGPPEKPYELICSKTTAVSMDLQWRAGFNGGVGQTFVLTFTGGNVSGSVEIDGRDKSEGDIVTSKLAEVDGIVPEETFLIQVDSRNEKGYTIGPHVTNTTLARPEFIGEEPIIRFEDTIAYIEWDISHRESLSSIDCMACNKDQMTECTSTNITDTDTQPFVVAVPPATNYNFTFNMFDGLDLVNTQVYTHYGDSARGGVSMGLIVGIVVGSVFAAVLVVVFLVLWRKGVIHKTDSPSGLQNGHSARHETPVTSYSNPVVGDGGDAQYELASHTNSSQTTDLVDSDQISPYGSTPAMRIGPSGNTGTYSPKTDDEIHPYGSSPAGRDMPKAGIADMGAMQATFMNTEKNEYAEVKKPKKQTEDVYSEVRKDRQKPHVTLHPTAARSENEPHGVAVRPVSVYPPAKAPKPFVPPESNVYANVNKEDGKAVPAHTSGLQLQKNAALSRRTGADKKTESPYTNVASTAGPEGPYSEVCIPGITGSDAKHSQNIAGGTGDHEDSKPFVGDDGITYARLDMTIKAQAEARATASRGIPPPRPIIRGSENKTDYASIDHLKTIQNY